MRNFTTTIVTAIFIATSIVSYSQIVASISVVPNFASFNTMMISQLSYEVMESETNVQFKNIDYSASSQKLALDTVEEMQSISVYKDGEVYLKYMPVFSKNLTLSMQNYEEGDYEVHLATAGNAAPTIIEITKS